MNPTVLEKIAVKNLFDKTYGRFIEMAYRHYSKTYNTALHVAHEIVTEAEVVLIYFEDMYENMNAHDLADVAEKLFPVKDLTEINSGKPALSSSDLINDDAWVAMQTLKLKKLEEEQAKNTARQSQEVVESVDKLINEFNQTMQNITDNIKNPKKDK